MAYGSCYGHCANSTRIYMCCESVIFSFCFFLLKKFIIHLSSNSIYQYIDIISNTLSQTQFIDYAHHHHQIQSILQHQVLPSHRHQQRLSRVRRARHHQTAHIRRVGTNRQRCGTFVLSIDSEPHCYHKSHEGVA